jgi:hypothetical protein
MAGSANLLAHIAHRIPADIAKQTPLFTVLLQVTGWARPWMRTPNQEQP